MILHTFSTSPFNSNDLLNSLHLLNKTDSILLRQDAVYLLCHPTLLSKVKQTGNQLYVLQEDVQARGLAVPLSINSIDYSGFVALTLEVDKVISW